MFCCCGKCLIYMYINQHGNLSSGFFPPKVPIHQLSCKELTNKSDLCLKHLCIYLAQLTWKIPQTASNPNYSINSEDLPAKWGRRIVKSERIISSTKISRIAFVYTAITLITSPKKKHILHRFIRSIQKQPKATKNIKINEWSWGK